MVVIKKILFAVLLFLIVSPFVYSLTITPISPQGNSVIHENSVLLSILTNKYANCSYSFDLNSFSSFTNSTADYWKIGTSSNILEISEDLSSGTNTETLRNITSIIGGSGGELKALASGTVTNSKGTAPYNQYLYLLGPGTGENSGYVKYTDDNQAVTADFLYFKSNHEIGRYVLEFTTAFKSGVYDSAGNNSTSGLFLNDFVNTTLQIFGKNYVISSARRITTNGGNINLILINGTQKIEIKDTLITDTASSNNLKVDDTSITADPVIIEGTDDNSTFKINRIIVNLTDDDTYYVPAGKLLSQNPDLRKPAALFTQNWDIAYKGLKNENTEKIKLTTNGASEYDLEFVDGDGNKVTVPIAKAIGNNTLFGIVGKNFINVESQNIEKDYYLVVTNSTGNRSSRPTYVLQYKGADKISMNGHVMRFRNLGDGTTLEVNYTNSTPLARLNLNGISNKVYPASNADLSQNDFGIQIDLDGDGILDNNSTSSILITTRYGAEINLTNQSGTGIELGIRTPDDKTDMDKTVYNTENATFINVTAGSGNTTVDSKDTIRVFTLGDNIYNLEFKDADGYNSILPVAENGTNNQTFFGQINKTLINKETGIIKKNYYFVVSDLSSDRGYRRSYALQYLGADKITADSPALRFKNLGSGITISQNYASDTGSGLYQLKLGGTSFSIYNSSSIASDDFDIQVDLDGNGTLSSDNGYFVPITTKSGVEINMTNESLSNTVQLTLRTFGTFTNVTLKSKDNVNNLYPSVLMFNISALNGQVSHDYSCCQTSRRLNLRTPSGESNIAYGYTSYGTFITRRTPSDQPATLDIDYPAKQREALVYIENGGIHSNPLSSISLGQHNITINCTDIFGAETDYNLTFNYTTKPNITSYFPLDGNVNISVKTNIILNFSKSMDSSALNKATVTVQELSGDRIKRLFVYNDTINQSILRPIQYLKFNTTYLVNVTTNVKDSFGNSLDKNYIWNFTTATKEGINDTSNFIKGDKNNINTNILNLSFNINGSENIPMNLEGLQTVKFFQSSRTLLEFNFNLSNSTVLDFTNLSILNASNSSLGGVVVRGINLPSGVTKTAYVERVDQNKNGLCIKDEEIDWIDNISSDCSLSNEYKIECDGSTQNGYTCTYNSSSNLYKVTGLSHSGVVQLSYTQSSGSSSSSSGSSSGGGSSGGGGGGGNIGYVCNMDWKCNDWTACVNGLQARQCDFAKVPQHVQDTECPDSSKSPATSQKCEVPKAETPAETQFKEANNQQKSNESKQSQITGLAVQKVSGKSGNLILTISIAAVVLALGGFFYYKFFRIKT